MLVGDVMTRDPIRLGPNASMRDAAQWLAASEASDLMVATDEGQLVGVLSEGDLLRAVIPDMDAIEAAGGSVADALRVFVEKGQALANVSITPYLITDPISLRPEDHVAQAATILVQRMIRRLPVTSDGVLVGTISRSDICRAVLRAAGTRV